MPDLKQNIWITLHLKAGFLYYPTSQLWLIRGLAKYMLRIFKLSKTEVFASENTVKTKLYVILKLIDIWLFIPFIYILIYSLVNHKNTIVRYIF